MSTNSAAPAEQAEPGHALCECGCGEPAPIAKHTCTRDGYVKGEPLRFISQHHCRRPLVERFSAKIEGATDLSPNGMAGCLLWTGSTAKGYGHIRDGQRQRKAMHVALELAGVEIPSGLVPDHLCRRPLCVNVEHLELVTVAENIRRGDVAKLTVDAAQEIRSLLAAGRKGCDLARAYGVSEATISRIRHGHSWASA